MQRAGDQTAIDLAVGAITIILVFEAARRVLGIALPIVCGLFLAYGLFGQDLPGVLQHRPYAVSQIIDQLGFGTEGIYGIPTLVSATYIFLFILFGAFLEHAGMIRLFNDLALGLVGHTKGGPAKVAVVSSGLMGTISGSGVANVLTVGQFTIPLMKRFGYAPVFAGAVEATSSMGGQIMPPVMGAVAFIIGRNAQRAVLDDRQGGGDPRPSSITSPRSSWFTSRPDAPISPACRRTSARIRGTRSSATGISRCRSPRSSTCCFTASRRCSPA